MKFRFVVGLAAFAAIATTSNAVSLESTVEQIDFKNLFKDSNFSQEVQQNKQKE